MGTEGSPNHPLAEQCCRALTFVYVMILRLGTLTEVD